MKAPALALVALLALSGCSASGTQDEALSALRSQVAGVRAAAEAGDHEEALSRLNALRSDALERQNELSDEDFRQILTAAVEVERILSSGTEPSEPTNEVDEGDESDDGDDPVVAQPQEEVDEQQNQSLGGSIGSGNPGRGRDGAPGRAGQDGQDGADGIDGRDGD